MKDPKILKVARSRDPEHAHFWVTHYLFQLLVILYLNEIFEVCKSARDI